MSNYIVISTALCLPELDIEALLQGRMIVAMPSRFILPGRQFALCAKDTSINVLPLELHYKSSFLAIAKSKISALNCQEVLMQPRQVSLLAEQKQLQHPVLAYEKVLIKAWATCELCQTLNDAESLAALSPLTIWTTAALQEIVAQRQNIFLTYLRVYPLPQTIELSVNSNDQFVALTEPLRAFKTSPILSDHIFNLRKHQLETRQPPLHSELEELQSAIASLAIVNPAAKELDRDLKVFLGWSSEQLTQQPDPDLAWINNIAALGDRSIQEDQGKSNYQAGTDFENIVRQSLEFLGFTVDYCHKGGAGGLDLLCLKPYPLFGECKAGKKIPNSTAVQLLNLGTLRRADLFNQGTKLIIGPGELTEQLKNAAQLHNMAIINPKTLENLVKLQSIYRNSIDLFKLKKYLKPGQSDEELEKYIEQIYSEIRLRSHIVQVLKNYLEATKYERAGVEGLHGAYVNSHPPQPLQSREVHEILVELSSPLTGYVGRIKGKDWESDRFYFLRDLPITRT